MNRVLVLVAVLGVSIALSVWKRDKRGTFLRMPYDLEWATPERLRRSVWDPADRRILTPKVYGWGYSLNLHAMARRLGLV